MVEINVKLYCPECKQLTIFDHEDDTQTKFYRCPNAHQTTRPLTIQPQSTDIRQRNLCEVCNSIVVLSKVDENGIHIYDCKNCGPITKTKIQFIDQEKYYCPTCQCRVAKQDNELYYCKVCRKEIESVLSEKEYIAYIHGKASQAKKQREVELKEEKEAEEEKKKERESQADRIYKIFCETTNTELFHDQNKIQYARIPIENVESINATNAINDVLTNNIASNFCVKKETDTRVSCKSSVDSVNSVFYKRIIRLDSEEFKNYLSHLLFAAEGKVANNEAKSQVISLLKYDADHGKQYHLYNRVALDPSGDGSIWLDSADRFSRAYHITKDGWTLENNVPILFRREEHQKPLAEAIRNGDIELLLPFMNIGAAKTTEITKHRLLLLKVQTASYLIPEIPHPINAMFGCPGSHKSCTQRYIRSIIDPSSAPLLRIPRDENAALQVLDHHYIPIFDQIFYMPQWFSDMLCSAVTGAGQESRALYTNDQPFIRSFKRCILLNGVNIPATKGDLLSRAILHPTEPQVQRLTEKELDAEYYKVLPSVLGGFLDLIVRALNFYGTPEARPPKVYRMADFTEWGCAITLALGEKIDEFIKAMDENLDSQTSSDIENNNVAEAFLAYFSGNLEFFNYSEDNPYVTTPTNVFQLVEAKAAELGTNIKNTKKWPSITSAFTRKLNDSKNAIIARGWNYDIYHDGKNRAMSIWPIQSEKPDDDKNVKNPTIPEDKNQATLSEQPKEKLHYLRLCQSDIDTHVCGKCQAMQAEYKAGNNRFLCPSCFSEFYGEFKDKLIFVDDTMPNYREESY